jgi:hypothetical protein
MKAVDINASHTGIGADLPSDHRDGSGQDAAMEAYQWFLLGMMVAWTPGLLVLALMLRRRNIGHDPLHERGAQRADRRRHSPNSGQAMDLVQTDRRVTGRALKS